MERNTAKETGIELEGWVGGELEAGRELETGLATWATYWKAGRWQELSEWWEDLLHKLVD